MRGGLEVVKRLDRDHRVNRTRTGQTRRHGDRLQIRLDHRGATREPGEAVASEIEHRRRGVEADDLRLWQRFEHHLGHESRADAELEPGPWALVAAQAEAQV